MVIILEGNTFIKEVFSFLIYSVYIFGNKLVCYKIKYLVNAHLFFGYLFYGIVKVFK